MTYNLLYNLYYISYIINYNPIWLQLSDAGDRFLFSLQESSTEWKITNIQCNDFVSKILKLLPS